MTKLVKTFAQHSCSMLVLRSSLSIFLNRWQEIGCDSTISISKSLVTYYSICSMSNKTAWKAYAITVSLKHVSFILIKSSVSHYNIFSFNTCPILWWWCWLFTSCPSSSLGVVASIIVNVEASYRVYLWCTITREKYQQLKRFCI